VESLGEALEILTNFRKRRLPLLAFEFFKKDCLDRVLQKMGLEAPFGQDHPAFVLVDIEGTGLAELPEDLGLPEDAIAVDRSEGSKNFGLTEKISPSHWRTWALFISTICRFRSRKSNPF